MNVILEKNPGNIEVTGLRTIILYYASFNATNKISGHRMMAHGEKYNPLALEQYGRQKGKPHLPSSQHRLHL